MSLPTSHGPSRERGAKPFGGRLKRLFDLKFKTALTGIIWVDSRRQPQIGGAAEWAELKTCQPAWLPNLVKDLRNSLEF
jgi:hypothetical protein